MTREPHDPADTIASTLRFYRETLEWLEAHHMQFAEKTTHDLAAAERANAIWKLSGESIAHATALVALLEQGFTGQAWPAMRAVHEATRLLIAVTDGYEERIPRRWLADQQVKQAEARAAEQREVARIAKEMRATGVEPVSDDVETFSQQIYRGMSRAAHHQRSVVDESVDHAERTFVHGPDPRPERRLAYTIFAGALVREVVLHAGEGLNVLWGPLTFYFEHLVPMLQRVDLTLRAVDAYDFVRRTGLI
jgi:hypothetical protein